MIHGTQNTQISQKQDGHNIRAIMKTMCPPSHRHRGFVATHALGHSVCRGSLMITSIALLALLVEHSLVYWYQQCVTVHHVPKCMTCHRATVVMTGRAHRFHDCMYIYIIILLYILLYIIYII